MAHRIFYVFLLVLVSMFLVFLVLVGDNGLPALRIVLVVLSPWKNVDPDFLGSMLYHP